MRRLASILVLAICAGCRHAPPPTTPVKLSAWFWHAPFALSKREDRQLKSLGISTVFVRAATMSFDGDHVVPTLRQTFRSPAKVHLVYNADAGLIKHFDEIEPAVFADSIARAAHEDAANAVSAGCEVLGLQVDFDCPTRSLARYARVMSALRRKIDRRWKLSITGLTSWLRSPDLSRLIEPTDLFVPQFYEGDLPKRVDHPFPLGDYARLEKSLDALGRLAKPVVVGIPSYSQCLLYDGHGDLIGIYRGLSRRDAIRHPAMKFDRTETVGDERHTFFRAKKDGKDYWLVYRVVSPNVVAKYVALLNRQRPPNIEEACLYRIPRADDSMANSLSQLDLAIRGNTAKPTIELKWTVEQTPFAAIERRGEVEYQVTLTVKNTSAAAIEFAPVAVEVRVTVENAIDEFQPGDFDHVKKSRDDVSLERTREFVATRCLLEPAQSVTLGPIRTRKNRIQAICEVEGVTSTAVVKTR